MEKELKKLFSDIELGITALRKEQNTVAVLKNLKQCIADLEEAKCFRNESAKPAVLDFLRKKLKQEQKRKEV